MNALQQTPHSDPSALVGQGVRLWWLGQAGFLIEMDGQRIVIDAYLSDSLAKKYAGKRFAHHRMTPAPVSPDDLTDIDWILCTHAHTDHMDPGTLPGLLLANPDALVVVPTSTVQTAQDRGVPADRMVAIDAGDTVELAPNIRLTATPAAHETRDLDEAGAHLFLGYVLEGSDATLWHSGDTIPFEGLRASLGPFDIDLALLPVNGRDAERASHGVPGNLTLAEALALSQALGVRAMIGHHLELFEFNTLDRSAGEAELAAKAPPFDAILAKLHISYAISTSAL